MKELTKRILYTIISNVGDKVSFDERNLATSQSVIQMGDYVLSHEYTFTPEKGIGQNLILNNNLKGVLNEGKVMGVKDLARK